MNYFTRLTQRAKQWITKSEPNHGPTRIQSYIFDKEEFTPQDVFDWLEKNRAGTITKIEDSKSNYVTSHVHPSEMEGLRTVTITKGIKARVGKKKLKKSQPGSSSVHVNAPIGEDDKPNAGKLIKPKVKKEVEESEPPKKAPALPKGKAHDTKNIEQLKAALSALQQALDVFLTEEEDEVDKDLDGTEDGGNEDPINENTPGPYKDPDSNPQMYPELDNLEVQMLKSALDPGEDNDDGNNSDGTYDMQQLVEGMDWELEHTTIIPEEAQEIALQQLQDDPNHYKKLRLQADGSDDVLTKDTEQTEEDPFAGEGYNIDLGSGTCREPGHLGFDLYPYDYGTIIHDLNLGIPLPDNSVSKVRLCNSLHTMDVLKEDPKALLSEIHRVMMPGGHFLYEGPNEIYNYPEWAQDYPGFVMINHEDGDVEKDTDPEGYPVRQEFTRLATPDPATANDAEPRIGVAQYDMLPADALLAYDALGYYWSDSTSSGRGNRLHGYPSQGALVGPDENSPTGSKQGKKATRKSGYYRLSKDQMAEMNEQNASAMTLPEKQVHRAFHPNPVNPLPPKKVGKAWTRKGGPGSGPQPGGASHDTRPSLDRRAVQTHHQAATEHERQIARDRQANERKQQQIRERAQHNVQAYQRQAQHDSAHMSHVHQSVEKILKSERIIPIMKMNNAKQIVYGVVLEPNVVDAQDDFMTPEDIEATAHKYLSDSRVIGSNHTDPIHATPVESFIAPQDFEISGQYGNQPVKKGSWILGVKVNDPKEWEKVVDGDYTGFSVGGVGARHST
jgi:SAM-dependent methyltransferase